MKKMSAKAGFGVLAALMHEEARPILLDEASALDADEEVLETLLSRLRKAVAFDYELGYSYSLLLSWLTARVGPRLKTACELVEAVVDNAAAASTNIGMPRWALSVSIDSALQRRMPCVPFIDAMMVQLLTHIVASSNIWSLLRHFPTSSSDSNC